MSVRIYVEGGGDQEATLAQCRAGFSRFFSKIVRDGHMPKVIACGSRNSAFSDFCIALKMHPNDTVVLLVDSEDELTTSSCWQHVIARDGWSKPIGAAEIDLYLMVRCMESWFLADKDALVKFYGEKLLVRSLPGAINVESIPKLDVSKKLEHATKLSGRKYHKTQHGFEILASLDPAKVAGGSANAERLIDFLKKL